MSPIINCSYLRGPMPIYSLRIHHGEVVVELFSCSHLGHMIEVRLTKDDDDDDNDDDHGCFTSHVCAPHRLNPKIMRRNER